LHTFAVERVLTYTFVALSELGRANRRGRLGKFRDLREGKLSVEKDASLDAKHASRPTGTFESHSSVESMGSQGREKLSEERKRVTKGTLR
jgi:hypothetical protein